MKMPSVFYSIFVFLFLFCPLYLSQESYKSVNNKLHSNNHCSKCKILTRSFNNWLEETSRGKYEGGDAAWEETKLKNYARSEMRLVEIQEKLCSDLKMKDQDLCYAFVNEVESDVEKWWHLENSKSTDVYTWLCIDELKYCCPEDHFGVECQHCLVNNRNEVCSGHGKCDGEGTRKGNGSCICEKGYAGDLCDKCNDNYFYNKINMCEPCHKACNGCYDSGPQACLECANGWRFQIESEMCVDVDECDFIPQCKRSEFCVNSEGSYACRKCHKSCETCIGPGSFNCSSCHSNYLLWSGQCLDKEQQQHVVNFTLIRGFSFFTAISLSFVMFRKSTYVTSIFVVSTSIFYFYLETFTQWGILYAMKYSFYYEDLGQ